MVGEGRRVQGLLSSDPMAERPLIRLQLLDCWMSCDSRKCLRPEIKKDTEGGGVKAGGKKFIQRCCLQEVRGELNCSSVFSPSTCCWL